MGSPQLPAGWLADRIEPRLLIALSISGAAFFGIMVGLKNLGRAILAGDAPRRRVWIPAFTETFQSRL